MKIAMLGGTGQEGIGLAKRFALAGEQIFLGSRQEARARAIAITIQAELTEISIEGMTNEAAAEKAEIVILTIPYHAQEKVIKPIRHGLSGKIVISAISPLISVDGTYESMDIPSGSAGQQLQALIPNSTVVTAFQNVSAVDLCKNDEILEGDVIVSSDSTQSRKVVLRMVETIKHLRGVDGGALSNAKHVEGLTALLLNINRAYGCRSMIKILGLDANG